MCSGHVQNNVFLLYELIFYRIILAGKPDAMLCSGLQDCRYPQVLLYFVVPFVHFWVMINREVFESSFCYTMSRLQAL